MSASLRVIVSVLFVVCMPLGERADADGQGAKGPRVCASNQPSLQFGAVTPPSSLCLLHYANRPAKVLFYQSIRK